jgi:hypothetical protein
MISRKTVLEEVRRIYRICNVEAMEGYRRGARCLAINLLVDSQCEPSEAAKLVDDAVAEFIKALPAT